MGSASTEQLDAIVIGAGFSGVCLLHFLRKRGFNAKIYEAAKGFGGVWDANDYPGARTDIPIPSYQLDIEEIWKEYIWKETMPTRGELKDYFKFIDQKLEISKDTYFDARIIKAEFDAETGEWVVETTSGLHSRAKFLLPCVGYGSTPYLPNIQGLLSFEGRAFHSTEWPKDLDIRGKKVGVIGTGATGVQVIQEIGPEVGHLTVFQRTINTGLPSWIRSFKPGEIEEMRKTLPETFESRKTGGFGTEGHTIMKSAMDFSEEEREANYEDLWAKGGFHLLTDNYYDLILNEASNTTMYNFWRKKVQERIHDPELAEKLAPKEPPYPIFSKRPSMEVNYYEVFNQPNVELVDISADAEPIIEVTPKGVRTSSKAYDLDAIVLATGFDAVGGGMGAINIKGTDKNKSLSEMWQEGLGKSTYLGMSVAGFPNMLFAYGPQSPGGFCNGPSCAQYQAEWIAALLQYMRDNGKTRVEAVKEAEVAYSEQAKAIGNMTLMSKSKSWQFGWNVPGQKPEPLFFLGGVGAYLAKIGEVAEKGYEGFTFQ